MTPQERDLVTELFDRLATLEGQPRDGEAERAVIEGLRRAPNAAYALVQTALLLLHHKSLGCVFLGIGAAQHGHRDSVATSATIRCRRMVATEFGMWRSGRNGGSSGSVTVGNGRLR
jgi:hypothetical protein